MRRNARIISALLVLVLIFSTFAGCGGKNDKDSAANKTEKSDVPEYLNLTGMPIVNKPITLKAFANGSANMIEFDNMLVWQEYEKLTGIKISWDVVAQNAAEKRNLLLASNDLPDMFFKGSIPVQDIINYGGQGTFIKINPLLDKYGPNVKKALEKYTEVRKGLTMPDGNIYSLPYIDDLDVTTFTSKLYINQKWLNKVGDKMPTTTEEFYQSLKKFQEKDANENGKKDEIAFSGPYGIESAINQFGGSFGIINRGIRNADLDADTKTGELRYMPSSSEYRELLQWFNKLFTEGLMDNDIFTIKTAQFTAKSEQGIIGSGNSTSTVQFGTKYEADYVGVPTILKGPQGYQMQSAVTSSLRTSGAFVITSANKYPEATMRWIDYFYGEDGLKLFFLGVEGKTFKSVNGQYEYVDEIAKNPKGLTLDQAASQYLCWGGGNNPSIVTEKYFKGGATQDNTVTLVASLKKFAPKEVWPEFVYTKEENEKMVALRDDIRSYVNEMRAKFIIGKAPFSQWDDYVKQLQAMGLEDYMKINKAAYERYKNIK